MSRVGRLDNAVIAGVGHSMVGLVEDMNSLGLQQAAALDALEDAGLDISDVDGLLTTPIRVENWAMPCGKVAEGLGIATRYLATIDVAGASGLAMLHHAAMAIQSGLCETVLCVAGQNLLSFNSRGDTVKKLADAGWAHPDFEAPLGPLIPRKRPSSRLNEMSWKPATVALSLRCMVKFFDRCSTLSTSMMSPKESNARGVGYRGVVDPQGSDR